MADISEEIKAFKEAVYGEAVRENMVSLAEKVNTEATASAASAAQSANDANTSIDTANTAAEQCNLAAVLAQEQTVLAKAAADATTAITERVQEKLDNGEFVGAPGPKGEKGEKGDPGAQGPASNTINPVFTGSFSQNRATGSAIGDRSSAMGANTTASGSYTHTWGKRAVASSTCATAGGYEGKATGSYSRAAGDATIASGECSHSHGYKTTATVYASHSQGVYNRAMTGEPSNHVLTNDALVIGNGTRNSLSNAFRVTMSGAAYGLSAYNSSGADYAEFIYIWVDGNPDNEDRVGCFVTFSDKKIRKAEPGDYILGVISGAPSVVGNGDEDWLGRYERDDFNRPIMEDVPEMTKQLDDEGNVALDENQRPVMIETGKMLPKAKMKQVADYDPSRPYVERKDRPEWDYVGMLGVIHTRDDGTCQPGQFCKCGNGGIATLSDARGFDTYMVLERIAENVVKIVMR